MLVWSAFLRNLKKVRSHRNSDKYGKYPEWSATERLNIYVFWPRIITLDLRAKRLKYDHELCGWNSDFATIWSQVIEFVCLMKLKILNIFNKIIDNNDKYIIYREFYNVVYVCFVIQA